MDDQGSLLHQDQSPSSKQTQGVSEGKSDDRILGSMGRVEHGMGKFNQDLGRESGMFNDLDRAENSSNDELDSSSTPHASAEQPNEEQLFPVKLLSMLDDAEIENFTDVVSWGSDGAAFQVHRKQEFERCILPKYFKMTKYKSFTRQLHNYGFIWLREGPDKGGYYSTRFSRNSDPTRCNRIYRKAYSRTRRSTGGSHADGRFANTEGVAVGVKSKGQHDHNQVGNVTSRSYQQDVWNVDPINLTNSIEAHRTLTPGDPSGRFSGSVLDDFSSQDAGYDANLLMEPHNARSFPTSNNGAEAASLTHGSMHSNSAQFPAFGQLREQMTFSSTKEQSLLQEPAAQHPAAFLPAAAPSDHPRLPYLRSRDISMEPRTIEEMMTDPQILNKILEN